MIVVPNKQTEKIREKNPNLLSPERSGFFSVCGVLQSVRSPETGTGLWEYTGKMQTIFRTESSELDRKQIQIPLNFSVELFVPGF